MPLHRPGPQPRLAAADLPAVRRGLGPEGRRTSQQDVPADQRRPDHRRFDPRPDQSGTRRGARERVGRPRCHAHPPPVHRNQGKPGAAGGTHALVRHSSAQFASVDVTDAGWRTCFGSVGGGDRRRQPANSLGCEGAGLRLARLPCSASREGRGRFELEGSKDQQICGGYSFPICRSGMMAGRKNATRERSAPGHHNERHRDRA